MKRLLLAAAFVALATPAAADSCPKHMADIDKALPTATLDATKAADVKKLRADGETKHKAGDHKGSIEDLVKAKAVLNIK